MATRDQMLVGGLERNCEVDGGRAVDVPTVPSEEGRWLKVCQTWRSKFKGAVETGRTMSASFLRAWTGMDLGRSGLVMAMGRGGSGKRGCGMSRAARKTRREAGGGRLRMVGAMNGWPRVRVECSLTVVARRCSGPT